MAILALTAAPEVLRGLPTDPTLQIGVVRTTAIDNADGTWSVTAHGGEDQIPALQALGCTVRIVLTDAAQLARWQVIDTQIDSGPGGTV
jgi:hypothetical protein